MKKYIYVSKRDKRSRIVIVDDSGKCTSKSYPRYIVEQSIGRKLSKDEDVHHIDGDVTNNILNNLKIIRHGEHQRLHNPVVYADSEEVCCVCGTKFIFTAKQHSMYQRDLKRGKHRGITCSKRCAGIFGAKRT